MIFAENAVTLAAVPLWLWLSYRIEKHRAIALAALWIALFSLALPFFARESVIPFVVCMVLRGSLRLHPVSVELARRGRRRLRRGRLGARGAPGSTSVSLAW